MYSLQLSLVFPWQQQRSTTLTFSRLSFTSETYAQTCLGGQSVFLTCRRRCPCHHQSTSRHHHLCVLALQQNSLLFSTAFIKFHFQWLSAQNLTDQINHPLNVKTNKYSHELIISSHLDASLSLSGNLNKFSLQFALNSVLISDVRWMKLFMFATRCHHFPTPLAQLSVLAVYVCVDHEVQTLVREGREVPADGMEGDGGILKGETFSPIPNPRHATVGNTNNP